MIQTSARTSQSFYIFKVFQLVMHLLILVMGQGPSPARARPGALGFWRALGPTLGEGLKPGPGPSPWSKARGLKGLLEYDFPLKNWHYFGKF